MSTRCQVQVVNEKDKTDKVSLYHHFDGYPGGIIPLIKTAFKKYAKGWEGGRVGKVASALCAVDVLQFEPLDYHDLHGDIVYYYRVIVKNPNGIHIGSQPEWEVVIYEVKFDFEGKEKDKDRLKEIDRIRLTNDKTMESEIVSEDELTDMFGEGGKEEVKENFNEK